MKKWLIILFSMVIIVFIVIGIVYKTKKHVPVKTVKVIRGTIVENAQAVGYIKPQHSSTIKSQIDGIVEAIYHREGEYVLQGVPLIKIAPTPSPTQYAQIKEELEEATAIEQSSEKEVERFEKALNTGLITHRYGDYLAAKRSHTTAKLKRILASQKLALLEKGSTVVAGKPIANIVKSPISGYILTRKVDVGDPVISLSSAQASTALFLMANMNDLMFQGSVDEADAAKIKLNSDAVISIGAIAGMKIMGKVTKVSMQSDSSSGTDTGLNSPFNVGFQVEITQLKIPESVILKSGYSATADIKIQEASHVLVLPERVIYFDGEKPYVKISHKENTEPKHQGVELGISDGISVEIKSGLKEGDQIIDNADAVSPSST